MRFVILLALCFAFFSCNTGGNMTRSYVISKSQMETEQAPEVAAEEEPSH